MDFFVVDLILTWQLMGVYVYAWRRHVRVRLSVESHVQMYLYMRM